MFSTQLCHSMIDVITLMQSVFHLSNIFNCQKIFKSKTYLLLLDDKHYSYLCSCEYRNKSDAHDLHDATLTCYYLCLNRFFTHLTKLQLLQITLIYSFHKRTFIIGSVAHHRISNSTRLSCIVRWGMQYHINLLNTPHIIIMSQEGR